MNTRSRTQQGPSSGTEVVADKKQPKKTASQPKTKAKRSATAEPVTKEAKKTKTSPRKTSEEPPKSTDHVSRWPVTESIDHPFVVPYGSKEADDNAILKVVMGLNKELDAMKFAGKAGVTHVYNPTQYAWNPYCHYVMRYGTEARRNSEGGLDPLKILFLGMNPGPWGQGQTGIPFGMVPMVREFLDIGNGQDARVHKPAKENPSRLVAGFDCHREEISGTRLWGWIRDTCCGGGKKEGGVGAEAWFKNCFIHNYCPIMFMESSGKNKTPNLLPAKDREGMYQACDNALYKIVDHMRPEWIIGVGVFAQERAEKALGGLIEERGIKIGSIIHPSPASPIANAGWLPKVEAQIKELGIQKYLHLAARRGR